MNVIEISEPRGDVYVAVIKDEVFIFILSDHRFLHFPSLFGWDSWNQESLKQYELEDTFMGRVFQIWSLYGRLPHEWTPEDVYFLLDSLPEEAYQEFLWDIYQIIPHEVFKRFVDKYQDVKTEHIPETFFAKELMFIAKEDLGWDWIIQKEDV